MEEGDVVYISYSIPNMGSY